MKSSPSYSVIKIEFSIFWQLIGPCFLNFWFHGKTSPAKQSYLLICTITGVCICEFVYLLKFICNPNSILAVFLKSYIDIYRAVKILSCPKYTYFFSWGQMWWHSAFLFQLSFYKKGSEVHLVPCFSQFCTSHVWFDCWKRTSSIVLSSIKCK